MKKNLFTVTVMLLLMVVAFMFGVRYQKSIDEPLIRDSRESELMQKFLRRKAEHGKDSVMQINEQLVVIYQSEKSGRISAENYAKNLERDMNRIKFRNLTDETRDSTLKALYPKYYE